MRPSAIVEIEVATDRRACFGHAVVGVQIDLLVFDAAPQPLDGHVVRPGTLAIHANGDAVAEECADEGRSGELAALIGVEAVRLAVPCQAPVSASMQNVASIGTWLGRRSGPG